MNTYIGIDLGTSGVKMLLVAADGNILAETSRTYPVIYPQSGWTEQPPEVWWQATLDGLTELVSGQDKDKICGISFGGQMHGLVILDSEDNVIRPCILWNDGRTDKQTAYLNEVIGRQKLTELTGNIAFAGFTAPKLLWLRDNERENFDKIAKIMLPKDYLVYRMSGAFCTDYSDASGTLLLDVQQRCWSKEMCDICGVSREQLPRLCESYDAIGVVRKELSDLLGLSDNVKVIVGAGDNAAAAIGTGTVAEGDCNVSLGTSGTIFIASENFIEDKENALHSFCHASGKWHLMGCILSAASARKWWLEDILSTQDYAQDDIDVENIDTGDLIFLPYLAGERSPHNDVNARGAFIGLSSTTTRAQMSRAVMEGVAFALRDCLERAKKNGVNPTATNLCGGGAKSRVWRQIIAEILDLPVHILETEQGPAYGGAILAMVGCGEYATVKLATQSIVKRRETVLPIRQNVEKYNRQYEIFKKIYPTLKKCR